jgi:hypothetical protein
VHFLHRHLLQSAFFAPLLTIIVQLIKKKKSRERFNHSNTFLKTNNLYVYTQRYDFIKFLLVDQQAIKIGIVKPYIWYTCHFWGLLTIRVTVSTCDKHSRIFSLK